MAFRVYARHVVGYYPDNWPIVCDENMNNFGFNTVDIIVSMFAIFGSGLLFGCIMGLTKYLLFAFMVKKIPKGLDGKGGDIHV